MVQSSEVRQHYFIVCILYYNVRLEKRMMLHFHVGYMLTVTVKLIQNFV